MVNYGEYNLSNIFGKYPCCNPTYYFMEYDNSGDFVEKSGIIYEAWDDGCNLMYNIDTIGNSQRFYEVKYTDLYVKYDEDYKDLLNKYITTGEKFVINTSTDLITFLNDIMYNFENVGVNNTETLNLNFIDVSNITDMIKVFHKLNHFHQSSYCYPHHKQTAH